MQRRWRSPPGIEQRRSPPSYHRLPSLAILPAPQRRRFLVIINCRATLGPHVQGPIHSIRNIAQMAQQGAAYSLFDLRVQLGVPAYAVYEILRVDVVASRAGA